MGSQSSDDEISLDGTPDTSIDAPLYLPSEALKPCPEFWFHDGSIVLHVEDTLFRVHQTILSNHSEVFADLFAIPQPQMQEVIEGCHVIQVHDQIQDMHDLLDAIYHPSHFDKLPLNPSLDEILDFVSGILRLSTKYVIRSLRQRCISLLTTKFPTTFQDYAAKSSPPKSERYSSDSVMRVIALAQETTLPELLPYAYYCVARMGSNRIMKQRPGDISWKDKAQCLVAKERLRWAEMSMSHSFLLAFQRAPDCQSYLCPHARGPHAEWHVLEANKVPNPLRAYNRWNNLNVCHDCIAYSQAVHLEGRKQVWEVLPGLFALPPWEELRAAQNR